MKRFLIALCGFMALPAFAEVVPVWYEYEDSAEFVDDGQGDYFYEEETQSNNPDNMQTAPVAAQTVPAVNAQPVPAVAVQPVPVAASVAPAVRAASTPIGRAAGAVNRAATRVVASGGQNIQGRVVAPQRPLSSRTTATGAATSRGGVTLSAAPTSRAGTQATGAARRTAAAQENASVARAGIVQADTVSTPLYLSTGNSTNASRVGMRPISTGASMRAGTTIRATSLSGATADVATSTGPTSEEIAQLTDFCKAQYYSCMDNFCDVLDDNQGRCSCSENIKNYARTETALKNATEQLQDVASKIQYIGLTRDEVDTLFKNTEAEQQMTGQTDTTQLRNDLDKIRKLIVDVQGGTANSSLSLGADMDLSNLLSFQFDNNGFDLSSLFGGTSANNSISNQRGIELYKTASARCKASVLDSCRNQGVDTNIVTNGYDLEIDRQCLVYERSLEDANTQMRSTVRNANSVLQKARLVVAQQKNAYDLRGCVNALDSCMQDEFVCGNDYDGCLDPSGKYLMNGQIVIGSKPGKFDPDATSTADMPLYSAWDYTGGKNAWTSGGGNLSEFISTYMSANQQSGNMPLTNMVGFLRDKIGYHNNTTDKNVGMCISVLNKCQDVTYNKNDNNYVENNRVVTEFLGRTLVRIKTRQDEIIADYAESCISDIRTCLSTNGSTIGSGTGTGQLGYLPPAALNACKAQIDTCASTSGSKNADILTAALCAVGSMISESASMNGGYCIVPQSGKQ